MNTRWIQGLAEDLPALWHAPTTTAAERKQLLRFLIQDVTLTKRDRVIALAIRWQTQACTLTEVPRPPRSCDSRRTPAAVVERPGVTGALQRSFDLTRGCRWLLFATGGVVMVVLWILQLVTQAAFTVASLALPRGQGAVATIVGSQIGSALFSVIPAVAIAVCYHDLRLAKEGVDTAELAKVFE